MAPFGQMPTSNNDVSRTPSISQRNWKKTTTWKDYLKVVMRENSPDFLKYADFGLLIWLTK